MGNCLVQLCRMGQRMGTVEEAGIQEIGQHFCLSPGMIMSMDTATVLWT